MTSDFLQVNSEKLEILIIGKTSTRNYLLSNTWWLLC